MVFLVCKENKEAFSWEKSQSEASFSCQGDWLEKCPGDEQAVLCCAVSMELLSVGRAILTGSIRPLFSGDECTSLGEEHLLIWPLLDVNAVIIPIKKLWRILVKTKELHSTDPRHSCAKSHSASADDRVCLGPGVCCGLVVTILRLISHMP